MVLASQTSLLLGQQFPLLVRGNECYEKKDYSCAADVYQQALQQGQYKAEERYLIEYRIGYAYRQMEMPELAKKYYLATVKSNPSYGQGWLAAGSVYYNSKGYDSASILYEKALSLMTTPADKDLLSYYLGESYFNAKRYVKAVEAFKGVQSRTDRYANTDAYIAETQYLDGRYQEGYLNSLKAYNSMPAGHAGYKGNLLVMGRMLKQLRRYDSAVLVLEKALKIDPDYGLAHWELGLVTRLQNKYAESNSWYRKALPSYKSDTANTRILISNMIYNAISLSDIDLEIDLRRQMAAMVLTPIDQYAKIAALEWGGKKQPAAALATVTQGFKAWYALPDTTRHQANTDGMAKLQAIQGLYLLQQKDTAKAMAMFERAIKKKFSQFEANMALGDIAWSRKNNSGIEVHYGRIYVSDADTLLSNSQTQARMHARKAYANYYLQGIKTVRYDVEQALGKDSLQKEAVSLYANALDGAGTLKTNAGKCLVVINRGLKAYAADKPYVSELLFKRAIVYDKMADTTACRKDLEEAIKLYAKNYDAWQALMQYYQNQKNEAAGELVADRLIKNLLAQKDNIRLAIAHLYKGDFLWRQGKKEAAKAAYSEALVWDPNNADAKSRIKMQ